MVFILGFFFLLHYQVHFGESTYKNYISVAFKLSQNFNAWAKHLYESILCTEDIFITFQMEHFLNLVFICSRYLLKTIFFN